MIFLWLVAFIFFYIGYLIKYRKKYYLIAGLTDYENKKVEEKYKHTSILIAESAFCFSFFLCAFSVLNLYVDWFRKQMIKELDGFVILTISLLMAVIYYMITSLLTKNPRK